MVTIDRKGWARMVMRMEFASQPERNLTENIATELSPALHLECGRRFSPFHVLSVGVTSRRGDVLLSSQLWNEGFEGDA